MLWTSIIEQTTKHHLSVKSDVRFNHAGGNAGHWTGTQGPGSGPLSALNGHVALGTQSLVFCDRSHLFIKGQVIFKDNFTSLFLVFTIGKNRIRGATTNGQPKKLLTLPKIFPKQITCQSRTKMYASHLPGKLSFCSTPLALRYWLPNSLVSPIYTCASIRNKDVENAGMAFTNRE